MSKTRALSSKSSANSGTGMLSVTRASSVASWRTSAGDSPLMGSGLVRSGPRHPGGTGLGASGCAGPRSRGSARRRSFLQARGLDAPVVDAEGQDARLGMVEGPGDASRATVRSVDGDAAELLDDDVFAVLVDDGPLADGHPLAIPFAGQLAGIVLAGAWQGGLDFDGDALHARILHRGGLLPVYDGGHDHPGGVDSRHAHRLEAVRGRGDDPGFGPADSSRLA